MKHFLKRLRNRIQAIWAILTHRNYALAVVNRKHRWYCVNYHNPKYDKRTNALAMAALLFDLFAYMEERHNTSSEDMSLDDLINVMHAAFDKVYGHGHNPLKPITPQGE